MELGSTRDRRLQNTQRQTVMQKADANVAIVSLCSGCGCCENLCPKDAIALQKNSDGFLRPVINADLCISCGLCLKKCPAWNKTKENEAEQYFYAGWVRQRNVLKKSSSGGVFYAIARVILKKGGVVYGAIWQKDDIHHVRIDSLSDIEPLMGSKYGQSHTGFTMRQAKDDLERGFYVLYCGTPCQIAGLKAFLRKDYERLFCFDILCHGIPSHLLEQKYLSEQEKKQGCKIIGHTYRDKTDGWRNYSLCSFFENGMSIRDGCYHSLFMRGFVSDIALNEKCYVCSHKKAADYASDITAGDCWGANKLFHPFWNHGLGISIICAHSPKGESLLKQSEIKLQPLTQAQAVKMNERFMKGNEDPPVARQAYLDALKNASRPLEDINHQFLRMFRLKYDVAIPGMWMHRNYGGLLTSYALYKTVRSFSLETVLLDNMACYPCNDRNDRFWQFLLHEGVNIAAVPTLRSARPMAAATRIILVGSDQVWNAYNEDLPFFLLDYAQASNIKLAYASSFGDRYTGGGYSKGSIDRNRRYLQRFDAISVREQKAVTVMQEQFGIKAQLNLDPVFLPGEEFWSNLADKGDVDTGKEPYVLSYILNPTLEKQNVIAEYARKLGINRIINIYDVQAKIPEITEIKGVSSDFIQGPAVYNWLKLIRDAENIITDSFHGCCFSIIFKRNFAATGNAQRGWDRFTSLLDITGLQDRLLRSGDLVDFPAQGIDYSEVDKRLEPLRQRSMEWLSHYLLDYQRPDELEALNREVESQLPPIRHFKQEFKRFLMRKCPQLFILKKKLKSKLRR